jgi:hypothetical protein
MTKDYKYPEEIKQQQCCDYYRRRARSLRDQAKILEEIADEIENSCSDSLKSEAK